MVEVSPVVCPVSASVARHQRVFLVAPQEAPRTAQAAPAATMQVLTPPLQQQQQRIVYILKPEIKIEQAAPQLQQPSPPPPPPPPTLPSHPLPPSPAAAAAVATPAKTALDALLPLPLDLSTKVRHDSAASNSSNSAFFEIGLGPRTSSCSSTSSRSSAMSDEERRLKRKEQNKAAAHNYRQRKKSFSDLIETEHENLCKKNEELKARKARLESQIKNMRALLDQAAKKEAKQLELQREQEAAAAAAAAVTGERKRNLSAMAAIAVPLALAPAPPPSQQLLPPPPPPPPPGGLPISIRPRSLSDVSPLMLPQHPVGREDIFRERKNTWPLGGESPPATPAAVAMAKERKKEQNKLASRRFRQRRRMEMTQCEAEGHRLEARNRRLREACEEMESKIRLLKDLMNNRQQQDSKDCINAKADGTTPAAENPITPITATPSTSTSTSSTTHR